MSTKTFLSLLGWLLLAANALAQDVIRGRTIEVTNGDTIHVLTTEKQLLKVRVAFVDAPESSQAFGQRAKQAMSALVFGKDVELRRHTFNHYGPLVCMVFVAGRDAGLELIKQGLAWAYGHYLPQASPEIQSQYSAAETAARVSRLGLWQDSDPVPPWEYRKNEREQRVAPVNKQSRNACIFTLLEPA